MITEATMAELLRFQLSDPIGSATLQAARDMGLQLMGEVEMTQPTLETPAVLTFAIVVENAREAYTLAQRAAVIMVDNWERINVDAVIGDVRRALGGDPP
jgi:hypothetical protein